MNLTLAIKGFTTEPPRHGETRSVDGAKQHKHREYSRFSSVHLCDFVSLWYLFLSPVSFITPQSFNLKILESDEVVALLPTACR